MNRLLSAICLAGGLAAVGCQQTQEADKPDTVIKETETVVKEPAADDQGTEVKMEVKTDPGGASAEVKVEGDSQ